MINYEGTYTSNYLSWHYFSFSLVYFQPVSENKYDKICYNNIGIIIAIDDESTILVNFVFKRELSAMLILSATQKY